MICWKFSKVEFPKTVHWCDDLEMSSLSLKDEFTVVIQAQAWLGLAENASDALWQTPLYAEISVDPKTNRLKRYYIHFLSKGKIISLRKNSKQSVTVKQMQNM